MTITLHQMLLYAGALSILFLTPGPVWVALIARGLTGGFNAAWPLAIGVVVGDVMWPLVAIVGVSWLVALYADFMTVLRIAGALIFLVIGLSLIRHADNRIGHDSRLTAPGAWAGFAAGVLVILGNPKAILFYIGVLPGFFDFTVLTVTDMVIICFLSFIVPLTGNLVVAACIDRARAFLSSPKAIRRTNIGSGIAMILVGGLIAVSAV